MLQLAKTRVGDYKLTIYEQHWLKHLCGSKIAQRFDLVLTGAEWSSMSFCIEHALRTGLKSSSAMGALVSKAQQLWPGGSQDEVAMKTLAPYMVLQYLCYRRETVDGCFGCCTYVLPPRLQPVDRTSDVKTKGGNPKQDGSGGECPATKPEGPEPGDDKPGGDSGPPRNDKPVTDPVPDGTRTCDTGSKYLAIVGQEAGSARHVEGEPDIVGAVLLPVSVKPNVPSNCIANVREAIDERIKKKQLPCTLTKDECRRIGKVINAALSDNGPFSRKRIRAWLADNFDLAAIKSKKWSEDRLKKAVEQLYTNPSPRFSFAAAVKAEHMPEGKAPRMLIADGDAGQVMALLSIACFEHLMFDWFENQSIKHASRKNGMKRVLNHLRQEGPCSFIEGDGSAWDTTCGLKVRSMVENPVLRRVLEVSREIAVIPVQWIEAHDASCTKKHLKLKLTEKGNKTVFEVIDSIRRSGHRGTSCLNWWVNNVMWVCALCSNAEKSICATATNFDDFWGANIALRRAFEGDDSGLTVSPAIKDEKDPRFKYALEFWHRAGFNMKIFLRQTAGLFVGTEIALDSHGPTGAYAPELARTFHKAGVSCSSAAVRCIKSGTDGDAELDGLRRSLALAKAYDFAGILPSVSRKYLSCAGGDLDFSHELQMRTGESSVADIRVQIDVANSTCSSEDEDALLAKLGRIITQVERDAFEAYVWDYHSEATTGWDDFKASLPASWRD